MPCADARSVPNGFSMIDAPPAPLGLPRQAGSGQPLDDRAEEAGRRREVEHGIAAAVLSVAASGQMLAEPAIGLGIVEVAREIAHALDEPFPGRGVELGCRELAAASAMSERTSCVRSSGTARRSAGYGRRRRSRMPVEQPLAREIVERRHQQALGEVARCAEDHERAWRRRADSAG